MTRTLTGKTPTIDPDVPDLGTYHRERLGLSDAQIARYFNAGVLLFNFAAMGDLKAVAQQLIQEALQGRYLFRDQDILNKYFKNSLHLLDPRWNVFNSDAASYGRVPGYNHVQAMGARQDPWLIHYADRDHKPWQGRVVPLSQHYWQALIRTPFYGEVLGNMRRAPVPVQASRAGLVPMGRALAERFPILKAPLLRFYALLKH